MFWKWHTHTYANSLAISPHMRQTVIHKLYVAAYSWSDKNVYIPTPGYTCREKGKKRSENMWGWSAGRLVARPVHHLSDIHFSNENYYLYLICVWQPGRNAASPSYFINISFIIMYLTDGLSGRPLCQISLCWAAGYSIIDQYCIVHQIGRYTLAFCDLSEC